MRISGTYPMKDSDLENPENEADLDKILHWITPPEKAPDEAEIVEMGFEKGNQFH